MSGISSSVGLFSGIDSASLIEQLLAVESRPKVLFQQRIAQLQLQQSAYLDINGRLNSLRTAASGLRTNRVFETASATSSNPDALGATARAGAAEGSYSFIVDRLVSTRQLLSRGFADRDSTALNATSFTFEDVRARLDRDVSLSALNGGDGIARGEIRITDSQGGTATIDLSRAGTVSEVLDAINGEGGVAVTASVRDGRFVITDTNGGTVTVSNGVGSTTATSLGIAGSGAGELVGSSVYALTANSSLGSLNDGNGVFIRDQAGTGIYDFTITVNDGSGDTAVRVLLGAFDEEVTPPGGGDPETVTTPAVGTLGGAIDRINEALTEAGVTGLSARIAADGTRVELVNAGGLDVTVTEFSDGSTARDLGLAVGVTRSDAVIAGQRLLAGLDSTLTRNLNGGSGIAGDGQLSITARDGSVFNLTLDLDTTSKDLLRQIQTQTGGAITGSLNRAGTGLVLTDTTGGSGNLIITGTPGNDTAESLGIATGASGVAASTVDSGSLQQAYVTLGTRLADLNGGKGIGTGEFRITDSSGATQTVRIDENVANVRQLMERINSRGLTVQARINAKGDGIELYDTSATGTQAIRVEDVTGVVARSLNIAGEAEGPGADNVIDGSFERVIEFEATDTLQDIASKINAVKPGVTASIINDGSGANAFRLSIVSTSSGTAGRFVIDTGGLDLGLDVLDEGQDARVFFGSSDAAKGVLLSSSSNTLDGVIDGVSIDLKQVEESPITLTVQRDASGIEQRVNEFIEAFNQVVTRIDFNTRFDQETEVRGPLLGDSTALRLRQAMFSAIQGQAQGVSGPYTRLVDIGLTFGDGGRLSLDSEKFRAAMDADPEAVEALLIARVQEDGVAGETPVFDEQGNQVGTVRDPDAELGFDTLGVAGIIEELARSYTDSIDGILTTRQNSINTQIELQQDRIAALDVRLETKRLNLSRQFLAMEQAIGALQSQQATLSQIQLIG